jgi:DNA uptake protein ComE-like DNA-binding protein
LATYFGNDHPIAGKSFNSARIFFMNSRMANQLSSLSLTSRQCTHRLLVLPILLALTMVVACSKPNNTEIRDKAQQGTEQAKQDAKNLAANTRTVLGNAEQVVDSTAQGVKDGIKSNTAAAPAANGKTPSGKLDLNGANRVQLHTLPGITLARADAIIAARPYSTPHELVDKGVLTEPQYTRISGRIAVP